MRVKMKTEQKFLNVYDNTLTFYPQITTANPSAGIVMATDSTIANLQGNIPMPLPIAGTAVNQITGQQFIYQFIDLRFDISPSADPAFPWVDDIVRLIVVTERMETSAINLNLWASYNGAYASSIMTPINTRMWRIHLDKMMPVQSGWMTGGTVANPTLSQYISNRSNIKTFRFVIPYRQLANILVANWAPQRRTYVIAMTRGVTTMVIRNMNCRSYFKDP